MRRALDLHRRGQLEYAQVLYHQVLALDPRHFDATHLTGVVAVQSGDYAAALQWIDKALAINSENAQAHSNRGNALDGLQRREEALASYRRAISIEPTFAQAHFNYARMLHLEQRLDEAKHAYDRALTLQPDYVQAWDNRGSLLKAQGSLDEAIASYQQALKYDPGYAQALSNLGLTWNTLKHWQNALEAFDRAIAVSPTDAAAFSGKGTALYESGMAQEAIAHYARAIQLRRDNAKDYFNLGVVYKSLGEVDKALAAYERAIEKDNQYAEAYCNRGSLFKDLGRLSDAVASYKQAIRLRPSYPEPHYNLGIALNEIGQCDEALASYDRAIELDPAYAQAHDNRATLLRERGALDESIAGYDRAIISDPRYAQAFCNRGVALKEALRIDDAIDSYDKAIAIDPNYGLAYFNKSLTLLLAGQFEHAWPMYEWRWNRGKGSPSLRSFEAPLWTGEQSLDGKTILLHCEQGLGDTIQFCRYVPMVSHLGAQVIFEVPPTLVPLMRTFHHKYVLIPLGDALPPVDYQCPLLSLPRAFKTTRASIPASQQYLNSAPDRVEKWAGLLGPKTRPRVGLVWSGNASHTNDARRSVPLATMVPYLPERVEYISLQKEVRARDELEMGNTGICYFGDQLNDFADTAALCQLMDLVISVDTSVAHLSGALGKQTCLLLPYSPDWRWLLGTRESPWYPTMTIFRQAHIGEWDGPLDEVRGIVLDLCGAGSGKTC